MKRPYDDQETTQERGGEEECPPHDTRLSVRGRGAGCCDRNGGSSPGHAVEHERRAGFVERPESRLNDPTGGHKRFGPEVIWRHEYVDAASGSLRASDAVRAGGRDHYSRQPDVP